MADFNTVRPSDIDVPGCAPTRTRRAIQTIKHVLEDGTVNNADNFNGFAPSYYTNLDNFHDGTLDLSLIGPQPAIAVKLTGDMAKTSGIWQATAKNVRWDGSAWTATGDEYTIYDAYKITPWAQTGDQGWVASDIYRQVPVVVKLNSPNWYIVQLGSSLTGPSATQDVTVTRSGYSDRTITVKCPWLDSGSTIPSGTNCRVEFRIDQEDFVISLAYACTQ